VKKDETWSMCFYFEMVITSQQVKKKKVDAKVLSTDEY